MKINKTTHFIIVAFLMLSILSSIMLTSTANAAGSSHTLFPWITVGPNPIGVGQTATIIFGLNLPPPGAFGGLGDHWRDMTVIMTDPNGHTQTLGPFTSDDTGSTFTTIVPDAVGDYNFQMKFPGQTLASSAIPTPYVGDYFEPATSETITLTVQQEPVSSIPDTPLPTTYWQTPVNALNVNNWYKIAGNWLGTGAVFLGNTGMYSYQGNYAPYTTAPNSAHIMWTKSIAFGGAIGGEAGGTLSSNYYATSQYEPKWAPIIMNGIMYYTMYPGASTNPAGWQAVDLFTGKTLWTKNTTDVLFCGQILNIKDLNQYGATAYLWATPGIVAQTGGVGGLLSETEYHLYDAMTGHYILTFANATGMELWVDEIGTLMGYYVNTTDNTLNCWNSTLCYPPTFGWRPPQDGVLDFSDGIQWTAPLATDISGVPLPKTLAFSTTGEDFGGCISDGVIVLTCIDDPGTNWQNSGYQIEAAYSQEDGHQLWIVNRTQTPLTRVNNICYADGVYVEVNCVTGVTKGYSITSGAELWTTPLTNTNVFNIIGGYNGLCADGIMYLEGFGGDIWAISVTNGTILWQTSTTELIGPSEYNTPYDTWPLWSYASDRITVADGKLFVAIGHEYSPPLFHGAKQLAINITNGELIWDVQGMFTVCGPAITDGIATTVNCYDNQIYAFGKGPTKITVNTPSVGVTTSTPITISGTVADISAGASQQAVAANFPNGLPCISDDSMSQFMEAVYMQQPMPTNATGVPISIDVIDDNGNYRNIGTTTSDSSGTFAITWTPDIPGGFKVIATFAGSESYYGSCAQAYFYASETPQATPEPTPQPASAADLYFLPMSIAIIIAIIVVAVVIILMLRKR